MLITFKSTRILGIILSFLALWCGIARVYVGVHWPFDLVGSIVTASIATIVIFVLKAVSTFCRFWRTMPNRKT
jgi:undecaprenyl-diphosphatase